jgi:hypothetical protein
MDPPAQLPRAVLGTAFDFRGRFDANFVARQMGGQRLVAGLRGL